MSREALEKYFEEFKALRPLVIGDVMVDSYMWGKIDRISPEAPVPIVEIKKREDRLGGAANVVRNLITMGSKPVLCSVIGKDKNGEVFLERLEHYGLNKEDLVLSEERPTTQKTRVISEQQQVLRVDEESKDPLSENEEIDLLQKVQHYVNNGLVDLVILEDYNKGVLTKNVIASTIEWCRTKNIPVTVDPKKVNFWTYEGVTLFKPNLREIEDGLKSEINPRDKTELDKACAEIMKRLNAEMVMITLSEHGVYISHKGSSEVIPAEKREITDVSGAGDTVIAVASLCLAAGMEAEHIARLCNLAGGLVCEKVGVVPITGDTLLKEAIKLNIGEKKSG